MTTQPPVTPDPSITKNTIETFGMLSNNLINQLGINADSKYLDGISTKPPLLQRENNSGRSI